MPANEEVEPGFVAWLACLFRGHPGVVRHPLGGFRCVRCLTPKASIDEFGLMDGGGHVSMRTTYEREHGQITRTWR